MGLQVSVKGEVLLDGKPPKGWRERLWARLTLWQVQRAIKASMKYRGLTKEQRASQELRERSRFVRGSLARHYVMVACCLVLIPLCLFESWICYRGAEVLKALGWAVGSVIWSVKARSDYRALTKRRAEREELLVDEVHDL